MIPRPLPLEKGGPLEAPLGHETIKVVSVEVVITASIGGPPAWTRLKSSSFVLALFQLRVLEADDVVVEKVGIAEAEAVEAAGGVAGLGGAVIGTLLRGFLRAVLSEVLDSLSNLDHEAVSAGMIMMIVILK